MLSLYNIAFVPVDDGASFIQLANNASHDYAPYQYCLGMHSIPHVSLCHFAAHQDHMKTIWSCVMDSMLPTVYLSFSKRRGNISRDGLVYWVSLIPEQIKFLTEIHLRIAAIVKQPLNRAFSEYDPHLTLLNSQIQPGMLEHEDPIEPSMMALFKLSLGLLDKAGQITMILAS
jgi:hypothetical protein